MDERQAFLAHISAAQEIAARLDKPVIGYVLDCSEQEVIGLWPRIGVSRRPSFIQKVGGNLVP